MKIVNKSIMVSSQTDVVLGNKGEIEMTFEYHSIIENETIVCTDLIGF